VTTLRIAHASMQFSDTDKQQKRDAERLFGRAEDKQYRWITGTEAGPGSDLAKYLRGSAREAGYRFFSPKAPTDAWVAVDEGFIKESWDTGYIPVIPGSAQLDKTGKKFPRWGPKGVVWVSWETDDLGEFHVAAGHYLKDGARPGPQANINGVNHYLWNKKLGTAFGEWAKEHGKGKNVAFVGADVNIIDRDHDVFFGAPLTTLWDELGKHENTGHGNIDVIATYDGDKRVAAKSCRALSDGEFFLNTDHFLVEAEVDVKPLKRAA
jgi:hypothetical protein